MNLKLLALAFLVLAPAAQAGTLLGHVRDQNWYARYQSNPLGVGYYEYAVNANGPNPSLGGYDDTDVFGFFAMSNLVAGSYTVASWDVWWRSAYVFNVPVPASGNSTDVDLRLKSTMWGYPAFWDTTGYTEFGQTFQASGPISMIYLRLPGFTGAPSYTLTVHESGPGGPQIGEARSFGTGDQRPIYGYGQMPTIVGRTYYARIRTSSPALSGVIMQMDPRPDYSDPMPGGSLWLGTPSRLTEYPDRDLGLVIMSDDDGLITNLYARKSGPDFSGFSSVGQTFIARGVGLISTAFWLADPGGYTYAVRVLAGGPGGAQVGTIKKGKPARPNADPEMIVAWSPGECPLTPGEMYYVEVTRDGGGTFNFAFVNTSNPFPYGDAHQNGIAVPGTDLAGTIMEEQSVGSAARPALVITADPIVAEADRGSNQITFRWQTDLPSDSRIEYAAEAPPYTAAQYEPQLTASHSLTVTGLQSHTMYHYRVTSSANNYKPAISRDLVICTRAAATNLLMNPGFELGNGTSPSSTFTRWIKSTGLDIRTSTGNFFWNFPPHTGSWALGGAVNGNSSTGHVYQQVSGIIPGMDYTFSAWLMTGIRDPSGQWKYDAWQDQSRLVYMRLGIDPTGGTNVSASTVEWTPRMYSHRHYTQLAKTTVSRSTNMTVFISMQGLGGDWHVYAADDCSLTHESIVPRFTGASVTSNGLFMASLQSKANRTNLIEGSSNLVTWSANAFLYSHRGTMRYTNSAPGSAQFFRARLLPER
ncbi:MAG TPA: hypothetical protein VMZ27_15240 [Candidatus Saccharimonadales bacterium]|nr:hypothetical protein [Candidatus Saccharimonadales bacterium]